MEALCKKVIQGFGTPELTETGNEFEVPDGALTLVRRLFQVFDLIYPNTWSSQFSGAGGDKKLEAMLDVWATSVWRYENDDIAQVIQKIKMGKTDFMKYAPSLPLFVGMCKLEMINRESRLPALEAPVHKKISPEKLQAYMAQFRKSLGVRAKEGDEDSLKLLDDSVGSS